MGNAAIIVAAGRGRRLGGELPKQYIPLNGPCALRRSIDVFLAEPSIHTVQPVIHPDDTALYDEAVSDLDSPRLLSPVHGGETRAYSVERGLEALEAHTPERVLIHDAARPFLPPTVLRDVLKTLEGADGACAALPVVDALWRGADGSASSPVDRTDLWRAQTPQGFRFAAILNAYKQHDGQGADDVAVARVAGLDVRFVLGSEQSYKITTQADLERALTETR